MVIPKGISEKNWFDSLVIDFPNDNIPILQNVLEWKKTGNFLVQENSFSIQGAPSPDQYEEFFPWAMEIFKTMSNF